MKYIIQADGSLLFRNPIPDDFVLKNFKRDPNNNHVLVPTFDDPCEFRTENCLKSSCGRRTVGYEYNCSLYNQKVTFSICRECVANGRNIPFTTDTDRFVKSFETTVPESGDSDILGTGTDD